MLMAALRVASDGTAIGGPAAPQDLLDAANGFAKLPAFDQASPWGICMAMGPLPRGPAPHSPPRSLLTPSWLPVHSPDEGVMGWDCTLLLEMSG